MPPGDDDFGLLPDQDLARLVLALEKSIIVFRRAAAIRYIVNGQPLPRPVRPDRAELMVLTALIQTYGAAVLGDAFEFLRQCIIDRGAVAVLQFVLLAELPGTSEIPETPSGLDMLETVESPPAHSSVAEPGEGSARHPNLAVQLQQVRPLFETLAERFPEIFFAEACAVLASLMPRRDAAEGDDV